jgi:uncharacterized YigZ family protein
MDHFFTLENPATAEFKNRGSKFLAFAYPIQKAEDFKQYLQTLKKEHAKAVHHCFAYRLGTTGNEFRSSDDGEPAGSAGKPILGQLDSRKLTYSLIVVVRYFGGTLLGVPGLINAYKTASSLALDAARIIEKPVLIYYALHFDYTLVNEVMQVIKQSHSQVVEQDMNLFSYMKFGVPAKQEAAVLEKLTAVRNVELKKIL